MRRSRGGHDMQLLPKPSGGPDCCHVPASQQLFLADPNPEKDASVEELFGHGCPNRHRYKPLADFAKVNQYRSSSRSKRLCAVGCFYFSTTSIVIRVKLLAP